MPKYLLNSSEFTNHAQRKKLKSNFCNHNNGTIQHKTRNLSIQLGFALYFRCDPGQSFGDSRTELESKSNSLEPIKALDRLLG